MPTVRRADPDACSLLDADHRNVKKMFKAYEELTKSKAAGAPQKKRDLANEICMALIVHAKSKKKSSTPLSVRPSRKPTCWTRPRWSTPAPRI